MTCSSKRTLFGPRVWSLITAIAFFLFAAHAYQCVSDFVEYRTVVKTRRNFEPGSFTNLELSLIWGNGHLAPFPAVTVCNLNAYKASELTNCVRSMANAPKSFVYSIGAASRKAAEAVIHIRRIRPSVFFQRTRLQRRAVDPRK